MKHSSMSDYDADVIPMVEYFNSVGLKTYMSCSGHKDNPYMSMFWIEFDPSVTEQDIIDFQRNHVNEYNMFCSCGRFVQRIIATGRSDKIMRSYEYMAANVEAANIRGDHVRPHIVQAAVSEPRIPRL